MCSLSYTNYLNNREIRDYRFIAITKIGVLVFLLHVKSMDVKRKARQGKTRQGKARQERQGQARQDKAKKARQGKARQGKNYSMIMENETGTQ